ncbi:MAG TPA: hypothetical protein VM869_22875 [Enhygromyxa sp.]|nr:hypothetical protein [Enhygromyxa sp.]
MRWVGPTLVLAACCFAGCSPEPAKQAEPQPQVEPTPVEQPRSDGDSESGDEALEDDAVIEIETNGRRDPSLVPVQSVEPTPAEVVWRKVTSVSDPSFELVSVASGIVGRSSSGIYELDAEQRLVSRADATLPELPLLGHWPDDVWYVESSPLPANAEGRPTFEYQLFHLDRDRKWVAEKYKKQLRWRGEASSVRKGWYAGVLVREGSTLTRIGNTKVAPKVGLRPGKVVLDTIETTSGRLYNISLRPSGVYVQEACFTQTCVEEHAKKLPPGTEWSFGAQVPRERNSFSMVATAKLEGVASHQLLHYGAGGWRLEPLDRAPTGLWPAENGGLWVLLGSELLYRTASGRWYAIALPEGVKKISVAMRSDLLELWVAAKIGEETVVFATDANASELPAP